MFSIKEFLVNMTKSTATLKELLHPFVPNGGEGGGGGGRETFGLLEIFIFCAVFNSNLTNSFH